jgi:hypothetical protein
MPRVGLDKDDQVVIREGATDFAVFRDQGASAIPLTVPRDQVVRFRALFGATLRLIQAIAGALRRRGA